MPRINLLPWREELFREQQKAFGIAAGVTAVAGAAVVVLVLMLINGMISHQQARNAYLTDQIRILDQRIAEIRDLEQQKNTLLARMGVIERLQSSRPEVVHLFDQLVDTLPDGVHMTSFNQREANLEIRGVAQSSARVSAYMRAIEASEYLAITRLDIIQRQRDRAQEFVLQARQVSPNATPAEGEEGGGR